jgi:hypothetical protein
MQSIIVQQGHRPLPQADPLPVVRTKNARWNVRQLIVESTLVRDAQQPDGQGDTCRKKQYEHDEALSETGPVVQGGVVGHHQCSHQRE